MKLTVDSAEALEDTLRVVGALYDVTLQVAPAQSAGTRSLAGAGAGDGVAVSARAARGTRRGGRRRAASPTTGKPTVGKRESSKRGSSSKPARHAQAPASTAGSGPVSTAAVRAWAREHGYTVAERGRVPGEVITAYRNAGSA